MLIGVILALLVALVMVASRVIFGPTVFDRMLAVNSASTMIILLIVLLGYVVGTEFFVDVALTYALLNFVTMIAVLRYLQAVGGTVMKKGS